MSDSTEGTAPTTNAATDAPEPSDEAARKAAEQQAPEESADQPAPSPPAEKPETASAEDVKDAGEGAPPSAEADAETATDSNGASATDRAEATEGAEQATGEEGPAAAEADESSSSGEPEASGPEEASGHEPAGAQAAEAANEASEDEAAKAGEEAREGEGEGEPTETPGKAAAAGDAQAGEEQPAPSDASETAGTAETESEEEPGEPEMPTDPVSLQLLEHLESGKPIQGKVFGWNQGGYHVLIDGLLAFCPRSEIDLGNPKSPKKYIEKKYPFRVIEHRVEGNRFIVSRAKILEEERAKKQALVKEKLEEGAVLQGHVTSLTGFGAFVDLGGGIEGMVHISELSHRSVDHPKELVKKGQKLEVKVLKIEEGGERISLSRKVLEPNPWKEFAEKHPRGSEFTGKITGKTDFGIFIEVEPGMEGLVHVSALPPGASLEEERFAEGQEISGWVKDTEVKRQRISLSLKPVPTTDPWKDVSEKYPEGEVVEGTVEEIAPFGVFINLEPGLTGLLPNSEMKLPRGTNPGRVYAPGSEVKVQVGRVEPKRKRMTLLPEGAKIEGSRTDYKEFKKKVSSTGGMPTLAAAFEKLKKEQDS